MSRSARLLRRPSGVLVERRPSLRAYAPRPSDPPLAHGLTADPTDLDQSVIRALQRTAGNQATSSMIATVQRQRPAVANPQQTAATDEHAPTPATSTTVYFDRSSDEVKAEAVTRLRRVLLIARDPQCTIELTGHASTEGYRRASARGSRRLNKSLSERRAAAVQAQLIELGVDADRIRSKGLGIEMPAVSEKGDTPEETERLRGQNRRVEITITRKGPGMRRLVDLQKWANRTRERYERNAAVDRLNLDTAREHLKKVIASRFRPILRVDAELWVAAKELDVAESKKGLADLEEASQDAQKWWSFVRRRKDYWQRVIARRKRWLGKVTALLDRAQAQLSRASTADDKAFWQEMATFYSDAAKDTRTDIYWLERQAASEMAQGPRQ